MLPAANVLRFVVALAGYDQTPAEEMTGDEHDQRPKNERLTGRDPERKSKPRQPLSFFPRNYLKVGEVADILMRDYGVWDALNLDGGGSTTMAMEDPVTHVQALVNASSDKDPVSGRAVGSSLAVFARTASNP